MSEIRMADSTRREFVVAAGAAVVGAASWESTSLVGSAPMYGLIGKMLSVEGKRDELIAILLEGVSGMPGCRSYVVARDPTDPNGIWITEVWDSEASHKASLGLPSVKSAIGRGRPLITGFASHTTTEPVGGHGLASG